MSDEQQEQQCNDDECKVMKLKARVLDLITKQSQLQGAYQQIEQEKVRLMQQISQHVKRVAEAPAEPK